MLLVWAELRLYLKPATLAACTLATQDRERPACQRQSQTHSEFNIQPPETQNVDAKPPAPRSLGQLSPHGDRRVAGAFVGPRPQTLVWALSVLGGESRHETWGCALPSNLEPSLTPKSLFSLCASRLQEPSETCLGINRWAAQSWPGGMESRHETWG